MVFAAHRICDDARERLRARRHCWA
jgi:hypothetical protein